MMEKGRVLFFNGFLLLVIIQTAVCTEVSIVGGKVVKKPKPWMVSIQNQGSHKCGGTLIDDRWVLTAAHCERFLEPIKSATVLLGALSLKKEDSKTQRIGVKDFQTPKSYSEKTKAHDIMLVELNEKVKHSKKTAKVMTIPKKGSDIKAGTKCMVSGWGTVRQDLLEASDVLREVEVIVEDRNNCTDKYEGNPVITEDMVCAGNPKGKADACWGDSGSPLLCKKSLVGLVSGGNGCGDPKKPGVYTLLSKKHIFWINSKLKKPTNSTTV